MDVYLLLAFVELSNDSIAYLFVADRNVVVELRSNNLHSFGLCRELSKCKPAGRNKIRRPHYALYEIKVDGSNIISRWI